ncbi:MAG TPA: hypothetical protein VN452_01920 [Longilinea sp.]|nr:hypothetical protein [Longilinea sp.]
MHRNNLRNRRRRDHLYCIAPAAGGPPAAFRIPIHQDNPSGLNGLFTLFLLDRWLDGGEHGLNAEPGDQPNPLDDDDASRWDDSDEEY